eukprot:SAG31_NODE_36933_length_309_cov_0.690476_1_plen_82_part_10
MAFVELVGAEELQQALGLHQSQLRGRRINVEASASRGGKSDRRKKYIEKAKSERDAERQTTVAAMVAQATADPSHALTVRFY